MDEDFRQNMRSAGRVDFTTRLKNLMKMHNSHILIETKMNSSKAQKIIHC